MMLTSGDQVVFLGASGGINSTINADVFGSGDQTISAAASGIFVVPGTGGGQSTINVRSGLGGTGTDGGGDQNWIAGAEIEVVSAVGRDPFDLELSATNGNQLFQAGTDIAFEAGTGTGSTIDVLALGSVTTGIHQKFEANFGLTAGVGIFEINTGVGASAGGTNNKVNVSANGTQSVDLRGTNSGLIIKGNSNSTAPGSFFAALGSGGNQTVDVQGNTNLVMSAGQSPALLTTAGTQTITVQDGGINFAPFGNANKEARIEGATQTISADFVQLFGGDNNTQADAIVESNKAQRKALESAAQKAVV